MKELADILLASQHKKAVIADCVQLIESHVANRGGIKGMALKTGLSMLKKAKPGILERATAYLLPEFIAALEPLYQESRRSKVSFDAFLQKNASRAAQALLEVADKRAEESNSHTVKTTYARMRGGAEAEVLAVIPGLSRLLESYLA